MSMYFGESKLYHDVINDNGSWSAPYDTNEKSSSIWLEGENDKDGDEAEKVEEEEEEEEEGGGGGGNGGGVVAAAAAATLWIDLGDKMVISDGSW